MKFIWFLLIIPGCVLSQVDSTSFELVGLDNSIEDSSLVKANQSIQTPNPVSDKVTLKNSLGIECIGSAGLYSIVYNRTILSFGKFNFQVRPQLSVLPGESESEIPRHLIPIIGFNSQFRLKDFSLNLNISGGLDLNWGKGSYGTRMISAVSLGPKLRTDFLTFGVSYVYFIVEPEYFGLNIFPHSFGITLEMEF